MTEPRQQQVEIPGYKIVDTLGEGGMATVYLAIQESFEREVALKVMSASLSRDATFGERFIREARIVSRLIHPNIVTVYDVGVHEGHHFLSMEYVPGKDLKRKRFDLSLLERLQVIRDVAAALDYAGRKGYVHRDVKPDNIMLRDEDGRAVLMDFGIARPSDVASGMTQVGTTVGTPHYMSPEQARGDKVDNRSDLYSLGVVLFLLISGDVPFDAESAVAVGIMHVSERIPRLPDHLKAFQPVIDRVLAKKPTERYQTGSELIAALDAIPQEALDEAARVMSELAAAGEVDRKGPSMLSDPATDTAAVVAAMGKSDPDARTVVTPAVGAPGQARAPLRARGQTEPEATGVSLTISDDDRPAYLAKQDDVENSAAWRGWLLPVVLVVGLFVGVYAYLQWQSAEVDVSLGEPTAPVAALVEETAEELPEAVDPGGLGEALSLSPPPPEPTPAELTWEPERVMEQLTADRRAAGAMLEYFQALAEDSEPEAQARGLQGQALVQDFYLQRLRAARADGERELVATLAGEADALFPEAVRSNQLNVELRELAAQAEREQITTLLSRGRNYLERDALSTPAGANALEMFNAVLEQHPDHAEARRGVADVARRYGELARAQLRTGNHDRALSLVAQGLEVADSRSGMDEQRQNLTAVRRQVEDEQERLRRARAFLDEGQLIAPSGENALEIYRALLESSPQHALALRGETDIARRLQTQIVDKVGAERFDEAANLLASARQRFPREATFLNLQMELNEARETRQPRIERLRFSSAELDSLAGEQAESISADRVIHVGFEFRNFSDDASVVQAILYDGSRSLQIATVPVIISGQSGERFFRIERPVAGFAEGGYHLDMVLGGESLVSASFRVKN